MPGPGNSIIVKNVPRSTNADVWDEFADDDEDDFLSPEMRERLKALDAETAPSVDKCPIQHDLGDDDALKCSKDWVNAIVSDAGICPFSLSADRAGLPLGDVRYDVGCGAEIICSMAWGFYAIDANLTHGALSTQAGTRPSPTRTTRPWFRRGTTR